MQNFRRCIALGLAGGAKGTPLADGAVSRCSAGQVSRPGVAGVVSRWCRVHQVSPGVPLGRCHVQVQQVLSPDGAGCTRCLQAVRCSVEQMSHSGSAGVISRWCTVHQVSPRVPLGRCRVQVSQVSSPDGAGCTRCLQAVRCSVEQVSVESPSS